MQNNTTPQEQPNQSASPVGSIQAVSSPGKKTFSRSFTRVTPLICAFCGGKACKHENWLTHSTSAIKGLNSDWVTDNILATQRPSTRLIAEYKIIEQFKTNNIGAILNLQEPGEHPHCGDGILAQSGFSYNPEEFYEHGIYFFNFGWRDMTATSTDLILKILKQMSFILTNGLKIAVHCHAGRGRTGMIIAAWLIYHENMSAKDAINLIKQKRKDSISKKSQEKVLYELEKEIKLLRMVFFPSQKMTLAQFVFNQKKVMPLITSSEEKYVPKLILVTLERMESLLTSNVCTAKQIMDSFYSLNDKDFFDKWEAKHEKVIKSYKERINQGTFEFSDIDDPRYFAQIVLDFIDSFSSPAVSPRFIEAINKHMKGDTKFTDNIKEHIFNEVDKKEFFVLESFARFFSVVIEVDPSLMTNIQPVLSRLCITLTLGRQKHDKLFLKRSLIKLPVDDEKITRLKGFVSKWIGNFQQDITESFIAVVPGLSKENSSKRQQSVIQLSRSKTLLSKTVQKMQTNEYGTEKEEHKANILHELNPEDSWNPAIKLSKVSSQPSKAELSRIEAIKEGEDESFGEEDVFPEKKKEALLTNKGQGQQQNKQRFTISVNTVESEPMFYRPNQIKAMTMAVSTPRLQELFSTVEELEGQEQDALLEKLMSLKALREKK